MTATIQQAAATLGDVAAAGATEYWPVGGGAMLDPNATEANVTALWSVAGSFSNLYVLVSANAVSSGSTTVTLRQNAADNAVAVSISAGATGEFEDTDSVAIAADDAMSIKTVGGTGGTTTFRSMQVLFAATTDTYGMWIANGTRNISTASQTAYLPLTGSSGTAITTESQLQQIMRSPVLAKNFQVYVSANARTTTTTFRTRKNTANGAQSVSVTSTATGRFRDTTNSDALNTGDLFNFQYVTGTGTQTLTYNVIGCGYSDLDGWWESLAGKTAGLAYTDNNVTLYFAVSGDIDGSNTTESNVRVKTKKACKATYVRIRLSANARAVAQTITLRKNGANTAQTASIGSSSTGLFGDTSDYDAVSYAATDDMSIALATGASASSATIRLMGVTCRDLDTRPFPQMVSGTGGAVADRLEGLHFGHSAIHLSDGTLVCVESDGTGNVGSTTQYKLKHYGADHATPTLIDDLETIDPDGNSQLVLARDADDNLYLFYIDSSLDIFATGFTKGGGYSWTRQAEVTIAAGSFQMAFDVVWCNTGGGTNNDGHLLLAINDTTSRYWIIDAGVVLAGAGTPVVSSGTGVTFISNGGSGQTGGNISLAPNGFGATEGISVASGESVGHWAVNSSGTLSTNAHIATTSDFGDVTPTVRALWIRDNLFAVVTDSGTSSTHYQVARYSLTAQLTAPTDSGAPTNMPLIGAQQGWDAYVDIDGRVWIVALATAIASNNIAVWKLGVDVLSGVTFDAAATAFDTIPNAAVRYASLRVVNQPVDTKVHWDAFVGLAAAGTYGLLKAWVDAPPGRRRPPPSVSRAAVVRAGRW